MSQMEELKQKEKLLTVTLLKTGKVLRNEIFEQVSSVRKNQKIVSYSVNQHIGRSLQILADLNVFDYETGNFDFSKIEKMKEYYGR